MLRVTLTNQKEREAMRLAARQNALETIAKGPKGYFWALMAINATPDVLAIGKSADEEIAALRAVIRKLGGEV